jgi:hypothetical protein
MLSKNNYVKTHSVDEYQELLAVSEYYNDYNWFSEYLSYEDGFTTNRWNAYSLRHELVRRISYTTYDNVKNHKHIIKQNYEYIKSHLDEYLINDKPYEPKPKNDMYDRFPCEIIDNIIKCCDFNTSIALSRTSSRYYRYIDKRILLNKYEFNNEISYKFYKNLDAKSSYIELIEDNNNILMLFGGICKNGCQNLLLTLINQKKINIQHITRKHDYIYYGLCDAVMFGQNDVVRIICELLGKDINYKIMCDLFKIAVMYNRVNTLKLLDEFYNDPIHNTKYSSVMILSVNDTNVKIMDTIKQLKCYVPVLHVINNCLNKQKYKLSMYLLLENWDKYHDSDFVFRF